MCVCACVRERDYRVLMSRGRISVGVEKDINIKFRGFKRRNIRENKG